MNSCDTVYFSVADKLGNAASFVNSNYHAFRHGHNPPGSIDADLRFSLEARILSLQADHPNALAPGKRALLYHHTGYGY
jgi:gamma-glutamyltranspeptidase / glutathione hydrolase